MASFLYTLPEGFGTVEIKKRLEAIFAMAIKETPLENLSAVKISVGTTSPHFNGPAISCQGICVRSDTRLTIRVGGPKKDRLICDLRIPDELNDRAKGIEAQVALNIVQYNNAQKSKTRRKSVKKTKQTKARYPGLGKASNKAVLPSGSREGELVQISAPLGLEKVGMHAAFQSDIREFLAETFGTDAFTVEQFMEKMIDRCKYQFRILGADPKKHYRVSKKALDDICKIGNLVCLHDEKAYRNPLPEENQEDIKVYNIRKGGRKMARTTNGSLNLKGLLQKGRNRQVFRDFLKEHFELSAFARDEVVEMLDQRKYFDEGSGSQGRNMAVTRALQAMMEHELVEQISRYTYKLVPTKSELAGDTSPPALSAPPTPEELETGTEDAFDPAPVQETVPKKLGDPVPATINDIVIPEIAEPTKTGDLESDRIAYNNYLKLLDLREEALKAKENMEKSEEEAAAHRAFVEAGEAAAAQHHARLNQIIHIINQNPG